MLRPHTPNGNHAIALVGMMWGAYFLNYCDRQAVFAMFPVLKADLEMTDQQLGLTGSIFLWVYGIGCPIAGQIADRYSKRLLVVFSLVIWSLVTIATGFATSAVMLLLFRAAMGVSESLYMPAAIALTSNAHTPEKRSRAVATLTTAQTAGTVGGAWFGGWMANNGMWREAFFLLGGIGLLYSIPYFLFLRNVNEAAPLQSPGAEAAIEDQRVADSPERIENGNPYQPQFGHSPVFHRASRKLAVVELLSVPTFVLICFVFPTFVFGLWMLYSWLPNFLFEKFSLNLADAGFTATIFLQTATLVGLLCGGVLADRFFLITKAARLWLMTASLLLCAPCLHLIGNSSGLTATCISAGAFGLFSGFFMGNIFPAAFEVVPATTRASAVGLLNFFGALGSGFAPLLGGTWKKTVGIELLLTYTSVIYIVAAIALIVGIRTLFSRDYLRAHPELPLCPES